MENLVDNHQSIPMNTRAVPPINTSSCTLDYCCNDTMETDDSIKSCICPTGPSFTIESESRRSPRNITVKTPRSGESATEYRRSIDIDADKEVAKEKTLKDTDDRDLTVHIGYEYNNENILSRTLSQEDENEEHLTLSPLGGSSLSVDANSTGYLEGIPINLPIEVNSIENNIEQMSTDSATQNLPYVIVNLGYVEDDNDNELTNTETRSTSPPEYKSLVNLFLSDPPPRYKDIVTAVKSKNDVTVKIIGKANGEVMELSCDRQAFMSWCFILSIIAVLAILSVLFVVYNI